ncbi:hypothetical protein [Tumebacillus permanentifrigoris]|uniref:Uncharacterized protein n=1 Tax=Tumebacillus permanentifrigoris TaxID=378543 RepID=A0A316D468_9BACL|nr:hypothetical protein [Tumebacillus permanentifrigoris]PWK07033.1 hypothetical protein C7459_118107 [Tumebacillus permanentifrigoris]
MSFKDVQNRFEKEAERLRSREQGLKEKIYAKKVELTDLQRRYQDAVLDGSDMAMKKMKAQLAEADLQRMEEHHSLIVAGKNKRLQSYLPEARSAAELEIKAGKDRLGELIGELRKYKAEYLGHVLRLNAAFRSVDQIAEAYGNMSAKAGKEERKLVHMPTLNMTSTFAGLDAPIGVLEREILDAFRAGTVQPWVRLYLEHGILVDSNQETEAKFRELKGGN